MREYGVSWENMENIERAENMEKMENINQITQNTLFMIQNICDLKHSFWQSDDSNTLFCGFYVDSRKIITYALGEHDPGSPKNGRTSSEVPAPCLYFSSVSKLCNPISLLAALVMANRCHTTNHPELRKIVTVISSAAINF